MLGGGGGVGVFMCPVVLRSIEEQEGVYLRAPFSASSVGFYTKTHFLIRLLVFHR